MCQLFMVLMNNPEATLMSSQAHAKPNEEEMLSAFVIVVVVLAVLIVD